MSKITATFEQRTTRDGYAVGVTVSDFSATDPVSFENCLLVNTAGEGALVRAATLLDMYNYLSTGLQLDMLTCPGLFEALNVDDVFHFTYIPEIWAQDEGVEELDLTVTDTSFGSVGTVKVDTSALTYGEFACGFTGNLEFSVTRGTDTIVNSSSNAVTVGRYPTGTSYTVENKVVQNVYRVKRSITIFSDVTKAINKVTSIKAGLQSLVTVANVSGSDFVIIEEEVFE